MKASRSRAVLIAYYVRAIASKYERYTQGGSRWRVYWHWVLISRLTTLSSHVRQAVAAALLLLTFTNAKSPGNLGRDAEAFYGTGMHTNNITASGRYDLCAFNIPVHTPKSSTGILSCNLHMCITMPVA